MFEISAEYMQKQKSVNLSENEIGVLTEASYRLDLSEANLTILDKIDENIGQSIELSKKERNILLNIAKKIGKI